jgi:hypothetical protein
VVELHEAWKVLSGIRQLMSGGARCCASDECEEKHDRTSRAAQTGGCRSFKIPKAAFRGALDVGDAWDERFSGQITATARFS